MNGQPATLEDWVFLFRRNCQAARALLKQKMTGPAWEHAGFAIECGRFEKLVRSALNTNLSHSRR